ncbi:hypothetical protein NECAME_04875 [Necator americanus]|uniref:CNNM transmembrane domain-containing protein n=1 Tax=Necator americanus TaxID=51031 RepID=W2SLU4_NECAM|nr:hypothetical protein NECAME_04875 [Necator americanus]ETN70595.1 hypothetical protein NECAME_04875 [Necator americanus]
MAFIVDSVGFDDNAFNSSINAIVNYVNLFEMNNLQIMLIDNTNVIIKNPAFSTYTNLTFLNAISEIYGRRTRTRPLQLDSGVLTNSSVLGKLRGSTHMFEISCIGISAPSKTLPENVIVDLNMIGETQTADNWYSAMTEMMAVSLTTDYPPPSAPPQPACTNIQASIWIAADLSVGVSDYRTQMQSILQLFPTAFSTSFDISAPGQGCSDKKNISNVYEGYSRISGWSYYAGQYGENDPTFCVSNLGTVIYSVGMDGGGKPNYDTGSRNLLKLFNATLSNNCLCSRYEEQETRKIVIWMPVYSYISDSYEQFFNYPYEHYVVPFGYELKDGDFYYGLSKNNGKFDGALPRDVLGSATNVVNYLWEAICGSIKDVQNMRGKNAKISETFNGDILYFYEEKVEGKIIFLGGKLPFNSPNTENVKSWNPLMHPIYVDGFLFIAITMVFVIANDDQGWETLQVVPHVSGLRVENPIGEKGFIGYTWDTFILVKSSSLNEIIVILRRNSRCINYFREAWELVVEPNIPVTVVIFGYWLDKVEYITFTDSICLTSEFNISRHSFTLQTETRIELKMSFPNGEDSWRMCVKQQGRLGELLLIDDDRTWINTEETLKEHYMPIYLQLNLIIKSGSKQEAKYAKTILPIRKRGNYLLCTILIMNVVVNAAISILFEDLTTGTIAFVTSSLGIVVFGEITPQSVCVKICLKVLDLIIGEEVDQFDRRRLVEILKMSTEKEENRELAADVKIAVGAMEFPNKVARDVMTKIDDVFMLSENEILDATTLAEIVHRGYTRIPVYVDGDRNKVRSLLLVKDLALIDKKNNIAVKAVAEFNERQLRIIDEDMPLPKLLNEFKQGNYHLAMVRQTKRRSSSSGNDESVQHFDKENTASASKESVNTTVSLPCPETDNEEVTLIGLVTLEDLLEEILQSEIVDESDSVLDNVHRSKRRVQQVEIFFPPNIEFDFYE